MGRDTTKLQYWGEHIERWQASGLGQRAYCVREGIKWPTFDYWRRQLLSDVGRATAKQQTTGALTLVPVQVAGEPSAEPLVLRGLAGWELRLPRTIDPAWLADVFKRLS